VKRDSLHRPIAITRFFFGNPDSKQSWTTVTITYVAIAASNTLLTRRMYYGPNMVPVTIGWEYGEEVLTRPDGELLLRRPIDLEGHPPHKVPVVGRTLYRRESPNVYVQQWFYSSGKQHYGIGTDGEDRPFALLSDTAYFRRFETNDAGALVREEQWSLMKIPIPFRGGEFVRKYQVDECGSPVSVRFFDVDGKPMADRAGIAEERYTYDRSGRVTSWEAYDLNGKLHGRLPDGVARILFVYRPFDGALLRQELYDENEKKRE
jgi:YD repeat-containing protein